MPGLLIGGGTTVDLSLPSDPDVTAAVTPNPAVEAARVTRTGRPAQIAAVGQGFSEAGQGMDGVFAASRRAQQAVGASFTNDGRPVYDAATRDARLPGGFGDAGTELHDVGRRLGAVADELGVTIADVAGALDRLRTDLAARRVAWAGEVAAATGPGGLIPATLIPALQARRTTVVAGMQESAGACGRIVSARIERYNQVLNDCVRLTGDLGVLGGAGGVPTGVGDPAAAGSPFGVLGARFEGSVAAPVFPTPGFAPAPQGPAAEVTPLPPLLPELPGFVPAPGGVGGRAEHRDHAPGARSRARPDRPGPGGPRHRATRAARRRGHSRGSGRRPAESGGPGQARQVDRPRLPDDQPGAARPDPDHPADPGRRRRRRALWPSCPRRPAPSTGERSSATRNWPATNPGRR